METMTMARPEITGRSTSKIERKLRDNVVLPLWPDTGEILNLRRNATYAAAQRGDIQTIGFGRLKRVSTAWLRKKLGIDGAAA
jgi:hypothetical protein